MYKFPKGKKIRRQPRTFVELMIVARGNHEKEPNDLDREWCELMERLGFCVALVMVGSHKPVLLYQLSGPRYGQENIVLSENIDDVIPEEIRFDEDKRMFWFPLG